MVRTLIPLSLVLLTGCYDFAGDAGRLGFQTDLVVRAGTAWTPSHPVAAGTAMRVGAAHDLVADAEDPEVEGRIRGGELLNVDGAVVRFRGQRGDIVRVFYDGQQRDGFRVRFAPAVDARLTSVDAPLAVVAGSEVDLAPVVLGPAGRLLGFHPADLDVQADGALSVWTDGAGAKLAADGVPGEIAEVTIALGDRRLATEEVAVVHPDDVVALDVVEIHRTEDAVVYRAVGQTEEGEAVLGLHPDWKVTDGDYEVEGDAIIVERGAIVEAFLR